MIVCDKITIVVEIDGDSYHSETASEAHSRTKMLSDEGAKIERINANDVSTQIKAEEQVKKIVELIRKLRK